MPRPIPEVPPTNMATGLGGRVCPALEARMAGSEEKNMVALYDRMRRDARLTGYIMYGSRVGGPKRRVCGVACSDDDDGAVVPLCRQPYRLKRSSKYLATQTFGTHAWST